ncbi:RecB family exonuclease [Anaplasma bovis]|uniref:RecB family exonuclease n=1 Tax=Anaplasma bovis TaxID=186733 RepID=UPI002FEFDDCB
MYVYILHRGLYLDAKKVDLKQTNVFSVGCGKSLVSETVKYAASQNVDTIVVPCVRDIGNISCKILKTTNKTLDITILAFSDVTLCNCLQCSTINLSNIDKFLLCSQFIEEYNAIHGFNFPIDLAKELLLFLGEVCANGISFTDVYPIDDAFLESWKLKFLQEFSQWWLKKMSTEGATCRRIDAITDAIRGKKVVISGIIFSKLFRRFLYKVLHEDIANECAIILPYVNLNLTEHEFPKKDHYQYWTIPLLRELEIKRCDIKYLGKNSNDKAVDMLFNFDLPDKSYVHTSSKIKAAVFQFESMEAAHIIDKFKAHNLDLNAVYRLINARSGRMAEGIQPPLNNISEQFLFTCPSSLTLRINSLILAECKEYADEDYFHIVSSLILAILDAVISCGEAPHILSMLKNPAVTLGYDREEYDNLVTLFEMQVVRNRAATGFSVISDVVNEHVPRLKDFWNRVTEAIRGLLLLDGKYTMGCLASEHRCCVDKLIGFPPKGDKDLIMCVEEFFSVILKNCADVRVFSLDKYRGLYTSLMRHCFSVGGIDLISPSFVQKELVVLSGFSEEEYFKARCSGLLDSSTRNRLNIPSEEEYRGYFLYVLYGLFNANCVYISRSINSSCSATTEPILLRYWNFLTTFTADNGAADSLPTVNDFNSCYDTAATEDIMQFSCPDDGQRKDAMANLSAEAVDTLINNPYVFYLRYVLGIFPAKPVNVEFSGIGFASIVHRVLRKYLQHSGLFSDFDMLLSISDDELKAVIKDCPHMWNIWWPRLRATVKEFFVADKSRKDTISKIENRRDFAWNIGGCINVSAKCDRVEYPSSGRIEIIRYKVGSLPSQIDVQLGFAAKEIAEAICVSETLDCRNISFTYWKLTPGGVEVVEIKDFWNVIEDAKKGLGTLLMRYFEGKIPFCTGNDDTKYAEYDLFRGVLK